MAVTHPTTTVQERLGEAAALLGRAARDYVPAVFASSFSAEDMVLLDLICRQRLDIEVITLDTGRLPEETHRLIAEARRRYDRPIRVLFPDTSAVEAYVAAHGSNAFYDGVGLRRTCCAIRKVEPLKRALAGKRAWITGQRREQAATRRDLAVSEWDTEHGLAKFNPLAAWTTDEVWTYLRACDVPYNALHDRGYASIGCAPCTRAIAADEDMRSGRWWWETSATKECGLHPATRVSPHGAAAE